MTCQEQAVMATRVHELQAALQALFDAVFNATYDEMKIDKDIRIQLEAAWFEAGKVLKGEGKP